MKNRNVKSTVLLSLFFLIGGVVLGGYLTWKYKPIEHGYVKIKQVEYDSLKAYVAFADSLQAVLDITPDTVYHDTIIYEQVPVYLPSQPQEIEEEDSIRTYVDSLYVEDEIDAWVKYKVKGFVEGQSEWGYKPIIREIETIIEKPVPYPVIKETFVPTFKTGNYISFAAGGNDKMFIFGVDYDLVKENSIYGFQYRRYGNMNVYGVKAGVNLNALFNKLRNGP